VDVVGIHDPNLLTPGGDVKGYPHQGGYNVHPLGDGGRVDRYAPTVRALFTDDHQAFRESFAAFVAKEITPHYLQWEKDGIAPHDLFAAAGQYGFLGMAVPEQHGGGGTNDFRFNVVLAEELAAAGIGGAGLGLTLHNDITTPYFIEYSNPEQAARWLPGIASGELVTAIAMTEPGTGSDLASIASTAVLDGDEYVLNGSKTFITNGINSDLVIVVAKTDPTQRHTGMSLLVVERGMPGFERGRNLEKIGMHSQDTAELFFTDVRVPVANLLGDEGKAFNYLTANLAQERLSIAVSGVATARAALGWTVDYVKERTAFGQSISVFQNSKFTLAEVKTSVDVAQAYVDQCVLQLNAGELSAADAAQAKYWCTELQQKAIDQCLQLFGGYGYMLEYPIARAYADARVTSIYGGTTEVMKTIIAKSLGL
jgi:alkylation response protein AidB-like acyl-CoA dehydrogenase